MAVSNVELRVDANNAVSQLQRTSTEAKKLDKAAVSATGNIQRMGVALRTALGPLAAIAAAMSFFGKSIAVASDREADINALADSLGRMGATSKDLKLLQKQADKFGNTTLFNQEDFTKAAKNLTSFTDIAIKDYDRIIKVSADIGTKVGGGVKEASLQLAKALNAPSQNLSALSRAGIQFSESQKAVIKALEKTGKKAEAQQMILEELEKQYGGASEAAAKGFAGSLDTLGEQFRDYQENVGRIAQDVLKPFVDGLAGLFGVAKEIQPAFSAMLEGLGKIGNAFGPINKLITENMGSWDAWVKRVEFIYKAAAVIMNDIAYVIKQMANEVAYSLKQLGKFVGGITTTIGKAVSGFFGNVVGSSAKGMKGVVNNVANGVRKIRELIARIINLTGPGFVSKMFGFDAGKFLTSGFGLAADGLEAGYTFGENLINGAQSYIDRINNLELPTFEPAVDPNKKGLDSSLGGNGTFGGNKTAKKTAKKLTEDQKRQLKMAKLAEGIEKEALATQERKHQAFEDQFRSIDDRRAMLEGILNGNEQEVKNAILLRDLYREHGVENGEILYQNELNVQQIEEQIKKQKELQEAQKAAAAEIDQLYKSIGNSITTGVVDSLTAAVEGTKSLAEVASNTLRNIANILLQFGIRSMFSLIPGIGPIFKRENGGSVRKGTPYLVGERGPELFTPGRSGSIAPNNAIGGANVTVNVDASGSSVQGDGPSAAQLGKAIGLAVQTELRKQQRPGGILAR